LKWNWENAGLFMQKKRLKRNKKLKKHKQANKFTNFAFEVMGLPDTAATASLRLPASIF
jgi:hypothetical protein